MATVYDIKIKTVSPFCSFDEEYVKRMFKEFLKSYKDKNTGLQFESTEVEVKRR